MSLDAVNILGINVSKLDKNQILKEIQKYLGCGAKTPRKTAEKRVKPWVIVTPNPEQIVLAQKNSFFRDILNRADVALPDGVGVVWASRILSSLPITDRRLPITKAVPGVDFMLELVCDAHKWGIPIGLIGGRSGLALKAFECLSASNPGLRGWASDAPEFTYNPSGISFANHESGITNHGKESLGNGHNSLFTIHYSNEEEYFEQLALQIQRSGVQIVFVGLGAPKHSKYFIERLMLSLRGSRASSRETRQSHDGQEIALPSEWSRNDRGLIFMSVGGSFDEISGRISKAPGWVSRAGLKWLWRLILEPWRIKRQLALLQFVALVIGNRLSPRSR